MLNLQEESKKTLPPAGKKHVAVFLGRFSPPTAGHYAVISVVKKFIREHPELKLEAKPVVAIIGGSKSDSDKSRNPLTPAERESFMKASGRANGVSFLVASNAFNAFSELRKHGLEPIVIAAGSDRIQDYKRILDTYFKSDDDKPITHHVIELVRDEDAIQTKKSEKKQSLESSLDDIKHGNKINVKGISSSLARRAVELGYETEFVKIVGLENKPTLARKMFNKIKQALDE